MPDVSVVIPTFRRPDSLRGLLLALEGQSVPADRFEVIVAIDALADECQGVLRHLQVPYSLRWTSGPHEGPGAARNRGVLLASGDVLLFLDDDMVPTPTLIAEHLAAHDGVSRQVCLGRVQILPGQMLSPWEKYLSRRFEVHYDKMDRFGYRPTFWDCLSGNVSMGRRLFARVEGFEPSFADTKHEDIELGYRLAGQGAEFIYQPRALSYHRFCKSLDEGLCDAFNNGISATRFAHRHQALATPLIRIPWRHYPQGVRQLFLWTTAQPERQARYATLAAHALHQSNRWFLPGRMRRLLCQLAYHLHFWWGVLEEARPGELAAVLSAVPGAVPVSWVDPDSQ